MEPDFNEEFSIEKLEALLEEETTPEAVGVDETKIVSSESVGLTTNGLIQCIAVAGVSENLLFLGHYKDGINVQQVEQLKSISPNQIFVIYSPESGNILKFNEEFKMISENKRQENLRKTINLITEHIPEVVIIQRQIKPIQQNTDCSLPEEELFLTDDESFTTLLPGEEELFLTDDELFTRRIPGEEELFLTKDGLSGDLYEQKSEYIPEPVKNTNTVCVNK